MKSDLSSAASCTMRSLEVKGSDPATQASVAKVMKSSMWVRTCRTQRFGSENLGILDTWISKNRKIQRTEQLVVIPLYFTCSIVHTPGNGF